MTLTDGWYGTGQPAPHVDQSGWPSLPIGASWDNLPGGAFWNKPEPVAPEAPPAPQVRAAVHHALLAGQQIRVGYGVSTALPGMDFETRSEAGFQWDAVQNCWVTPEGAADKSYGLEVVGRRNYITHHTFGVLSLCYDLLDGNGLRTWYPSARTQHLTAADRSDPWAAPWELIDHIAAGGLMSSWYSGFEFDVWNLYCVPTWGWPVLRLEQTRCDMAKARAHGGPGKLANFGKAFRLTIQKDKDGKRLLDKFSVPRDPTKTNPNTWIYPHEDTADFAKLLSYNGDDVRTEAEASLRCPDLSPEELHIWMVDQQVNARGIQVDVVALENCIEIVRQARDKYNAELCTLTGGAVKEASELPSLKKWLNAQGVEVGSLTKELIAEWIDRLPPGPARRALEIRQALGSASINKLFAFKHQNHLGRLYDLYSYFAARTGRWTGNGPQPQNLPSGIFDSLAKVERALSVIAHRVLELVEYEYPGHTALEVIGSVLRGLLVAAPGHDLVCSDYTGIENVVAAGLSGEEWVLEVYRTHGLMYEATAAKIAKLPFDDFVKHRVDSGGVPRYENGKLVEILGGKHHPLRKKLGKFGVLGSQFGGWIGAWKGFGADEYLNDAEIKEAILAWREANPNIVELWGGQTRGRFNDAYPELFGLEGAAIAAVQYPGKPFSPATNKNITYEMDAEQDVLYCRVPSGGYLTYHRPRLEGSKRDWAPPWEVSLSYEGDNKNPKMGPTGWIRMSLYGGKQFENIVQKEARSIFASGLVGLEKAGYRPILHSHDEPCGEVPKGWGTIEEFEAIMCNIAHVPGSFCYGWPIRAKGGWRGPRYGKFEE